MGETMGEQMGELPRGVSVEDVPMFVEAFFLALDQLQASSQAKDTSSEDGLTSSLSAHRGNESPHAPG
jgi:hypothetical protein